MQNHLKKLKNLFSSSETSEPWQIKAARFCVEHGVFTEKELLTYITDELKQDGLTAQFFLNENIHQPAGKQFGRQSSGGKWSAPLELVSMVTDYDELKEACKNAKEAWRMALLALIVGSVSAIFQALDYFSN